MKVFAYEVTHSNVDTVKVGTCLIDREFESEPVRHWHLWSELTGEFSIGWTGIRRDELCAECRDLPVRKIALPHIGEHGESVEMYVPGWLAARTEEGN